MVARRNAAMWNNAFGNTGHASFLHHMEDLSWTEHPVGLASHLAGSVKQLTKWSLADQEPIGRQLSF